MGEARNNIRSEQFRGALPDNMLSARCSIRVQPSVEWSEEMAAKMEGLPQDEIAKLANSCPPKDRMVVVGIQAVVIVPLSTAPREQWPMIGVGLGETTLPLVELLKMAKTSLAEKDTAIAALMKIPGEDDEPKVIL